MIRLDDRLRCALDMLRGIGSVADIGCDHGKLTAALLLEGGCQRVIAGDVSADCLQKTREIVDRYGLQDRALVRLGDGLTILSPGECQGAAILGMGGELMIELMESSPDVTAGMDRLVLQPMSGVNELRRWLYENRFHVIADKLATVGRRRYQVVCVQKRDKPDPWPEGFPEQCYLVGYRTFADRDERLAAYCRELLTQRNERLKQAAGTAGEARLSREAKQLIQILEEIKRWS